MLSQKTIFRVSRFAHILVSAFQPIRLNLVKKLTRDFGFSFYRPFESKFAQTQEGGTFEVEFEFAAMPPKLRLTVYFRGSFKIKTLHSERFDFKALPYP